MPKRKSPTKAKAVRKTTAKKAKPMPVKTYISEHGFLIRPPYTG
jgi:hypothetical protein